MEAAAAAGTQVGVASRNMGQGLTRSMTRARNAEKARDDYKPMAPAVSSPTNPLAPGAAEWAADEGESMKASSTFQCSRSVKDSRALRSQKTVNNLVSYSDTGKLSISMGKENDRSEFLEHHSIVKKQVEALGRTTISPQSRFIGRWDVVIGLALLWTAFVTPFEVGFQTPAGPGSDRPVGALFVCNRFVDAIFLIDMCLQFFIPYRESQTKGGMLVFDNRKIALQYVRSWFTLDLLTAVPFDVLLTLAFQVANLPRSHQISP